MNPTPLRNALHNRLRDALAPVKVWTQVPQGEPFPYVRLGQLTMADDSPKDGEMNEYELQVHVFTRDRTVKGPEPIEAILSAIHASLHGKDGEIALSFGRLVLIRCTYSTAFQEEGDTPDLWHGVQRYRILTQDT